MSDIFPEAKLKLAEFDASKLKTSPSATISDAFDNCGGADTTKVRGTTNDAETESTTVRVS
jgi:hypothetical protein